MSRFISSSQQLPKFKPRRLPWGTSPLPALLYASPSFIFIRMPELQLCSLGVWSSAWGFQQQVALCERVYVCVWRRRRVKIGSNLSQMSAEILLRRSFFDICRLITLAVDPPQHSVTWCYKGQWADSLQLGTCTQFVHSCLYARTQDTGYCRNALQFFWMVSLYKYSILYFFFYCDSHPPSFF